MPKNPVNRILVRMFLYGMAYGSLAGGLLFMAFMYTVFQLDDVFRWSYSALIGGFILGLPVGCIVGGFAGIFSGLAINILLDVFAPYPLTPAIVNRYRRSIGFVTACMSAGVFLIPFGGSIVMFNYVLHDVAIMGFIISIGIAIYASQQTIIKYLRESDVRKRKTHE